MFEATVDDSPENFRLQQEISKSWAVDGHIGSFDAVFLGVLGAAVGPIGGGSVGVRTRSLRRGAGILLLIVKKLGLNISHCSYKKEKKNVSGIKKADVSWWKAGKSQIKQDLEVNYVIEAKQPIL